MQEIDGVAEVKVDHASGNATVKMEPGVSFDEAKAHELIDRDFKLVSCVEVAN